MTQLEKLHPDAAEQKQITDARKATKEYFEAAKKWVEVQKATAAGATVMESKHAVVMKKYNEFVRPQGKGVSRGQERRSPQEQSSNHAPEGNTVADWANAAVLYSKKYMLDGKAENWKGVTDNIDGLMKNFADLRKAGATTKRIARR